jgi:hypothetical protein
MSETKKETGRARGEATTGSIKVETKKEVMPGAHLYRCEAHNLTFTTKEALEEHLKTHKK